MKKKEKKREKKVKETHLKAIIFKLIGRRQ
jgi:hypothetical protein